MSGVKKQGSIESYKFHHIDTSKCRECKEFSCEEACFKGVYEVIDKETQPRCVVVKEREEMCAKCHMCTTACKLRAITID
ncbi:MAG: ferredoxin [Promethearchaeota archaeon]